MRIISDTRKWVTRHIPMLSFKDFLAVQYTGGESEQQDLNAKKRHAGVVGEDKLGDRLAKAKGQEMVKAHHKKLGPDPQSPAQIKKKAQDSKTQSAAS